MPEKVQCPNCMEPAEKSGNKITCVACDSVLTVTRTGGAKLVDAGWKAKIEERLGVLEVGLADDPAADANEAEAQAQADADAAAAAEAAADEETFLEE